MTARQLSPQTYLSAGLACLTTVFGVWLVLEQIWFADVVLKSGKYSLGMAGVIASLLGVALAAFFWRKLGKQAEAGETSFRYLLEAAPDAILIMDRFGRIALINAQTEKLFGFSRDELVGKPAETLISRHESDSRLDRTTVGNTTIE